MTYVRPNVEIITFGEDSIFMTSSVDYSNYSTAKEALLVACGGYGGEHTNNFNCSSFGPYNATNPPTQNAQVVLGDNLYIFDYKGNHWKLHK